MGILDFEDDLAGTRGRQTKESPSRRREALRDLSFSSEKEEVGICAYVMDNRVSCRIRSTRSIRTRFTPKSNRSVIGQGTPACFVTQRFGILKKS